MPEVRPIDANALKDKLEKSQAKAFISAEWGVAGVIAAIIRVIDEQPTIEKDDDGSGVGQALSPD